MFARRTWDELCFQELGANSSVHRILERCVHWLQQKGHGDTATYSAGWQILEDVMKFAIEPACREPTLITHFPADLQHVCDMDLKSGQARRFSLVMRGIEFSDGGLKFSNAVGYRRAYERNARYREDVLGVPHNALPEEFFEELDAWPAPVFSSGVGLDRLTALVAGCDVAGAIQFQSG